MPPSEVKERHADQPAGQRSADDAGHLQRGQHQRDGSRTVPGTEPARDAGSVEHRVQTGFRHAQQEPQQVEFPGRGDEGHQAGGNAPGDHDSGQPPFRTEPLGDQRSGNLEQEVTDEEDTRTQAEHLIREIQILVHRQRGIAQVDAIHVGDDRSDEQRQDDIHSTPYVWHSQLRRNYIMGQDSAISRASQAERRANQHV